MHVSLQIAGPQPQNGPELFPLRLTTRPPLSPAGGALAAVLDDAATALVAALGPRLRQAEAAHRQQLAEDWGRGALALTRTGRGSPGGQGGGAACKQRNLRFFVRKSCSLKICMFFWLFLLHCLHCMRFEVCCSIPPPSAEGWQHSPRTPDQGQ